MIVEMSSDRKLVSHFLRGTVVALMFIALGEILVKLDVNHYRSLAVGVVIMALFYELVIIRQAKSHLISRIVRPLAIPLPFIAISGVYLFIMSNVFQTHEVGAEAFTFAIVVVIYEIIAANKKCVSRHLGLNFTFLILGVALLLKLDLILHYLI